MLRLTADGHKASRGLSTTAELLVLQLRKLRALREKRREHFSADGEWLSDRAIKFARWQHPAVGRRARFVVFGALIRPCLQVTWA